MGRRYSSQIENPPSFYQKVPQGEVYPHEEKESFHCRVDRHGTPFGNRVSSDNSRFQPLKNKITPGNPSRSPLARTQDAHHVVAHGRGSVPSRYKPPNPPQLQWRVQEHTKPPHGPPQVPALRSPSTPAPPLGRNLHESDFSKQSEISSAEKVFEDLREVTLQYINCANPIESAARRRRVIQTETENLMANTTSGIIAAATAAASQTAMVPQVNPTVILLPSSETSTLNRAPQTSGDGMTTTITATKRRGRPPRTRKSTPNPRLVGGSAKKCIFSKVQPSPGKLNATPVRKGRNRVAPSPAHDASVPVVSQGSAPSTSANNQGFHNPGNPFPKP